MAAIDGLLHRMKDAGASDLHLKSGSRPRYRIHGYLADVEGAAPLTREQVDAMTRELLTEEQERFFRETGEIDFAYGDLKSGRFRCNFFQDHNGPAATFRRLPLQIPTLKELNLPPVLESFVHLRSGLVLVTGPTGSGKTSTLAALLDLVNSEYRKHIITLEDPIEYLHPSKKSVVHQRGLHYDITDFASGVRAALREDPDLLLIGEMRDLETIEAALTIAETGHLTFGTLHTNSAVQTINRIIDVFPPHQQPQIRAQLSFVLEGVMCQMLLRRANGQGRVLVLEIMVPNAAIRNLIREDKIHQIYGMMQSGKEKSGMQTMNESLLWHYLRRNITKEQALGASTLPDELLQMMDRAQAGQSPYLAAAGGAGRR
jgi:twitching motility protein PilT